MSEADGAPTAYTVPYDSAHWESMIAWDVFINGEVVPVHVQPIVVKQEMVPLTAEISSGRNAKAACVSCVYVDTDAVCIEGV